MISVSSCAIRDMYQILMFSHRCLEVDASVVVQWWTPHLVHEWGKGNTPFLKRWSPLHLQFEELS
jgi:hypothetical protein